MVTALFCDLVGFTASSESADPEDVNEMLAAYSEMARAIIEQHGGVVEKFIGDAVVGVFGVPAVHEDDPERAVRAALRIVEGADGLQATGGEPLRLRVGINTGEALVRLGVTPGSGEGFLRGDAINTAARIQSVAPAMGVAVGMATYTATSEVFDYAELDAAALKGKSGPVRVFQATAPRARFGTDVTRTHSSPFVGRAVDLALLGGLFEKTVQADSVQLVTVVGEPGLGKSRIVAEFGASLGDRPHPVTWRSGRCLPYGEGITYWALAEIVKAHAGILESDPSGVAARKLDVVLADGPERAWIRQRLQPLLGIGGSSPADREESFTAWRRFLELIAEDGPTVLVVEDLHWADAAMLAFLEHLADRAEGVPLLILCTARPELFERHPGFASSLRNSTPITLTPLSAQETGRLVAALLETGELPDGLDRSILDRADGNPLYTEEFVRLLQDRDRLVRNGPDWELREGAEELSPDSVRALIAARLDTLPPGSKSLLADAAVIGRVFWAGAIADMAERPLDEVTETLRELSRKELVRASRHSSVEGEAEYAFWHALTRDVAYATLPRASRAARHAAAARWIESQVPDRAQDVADVLAYHYATALELATAAGQTEQVAELKGPAVRFLTLAGERALRLDPAAALANLEGAMRLTRVDDPGWPRLQVKILKAAGLLWERPLSDYGPSYQVLVDRFRELGQVEGEAEALMGVADMTVDTDTAAAEALLRQAIALLETVGEGPLLAHAYCGLGARLQNTGGSEEGAQFIGRALDLAERLDLPDVAGGALQWRGMRRVSSGDIGGLEDLHQALQVCLENGLADSAGDAYVSLADMLWDTEGLAEGLAVYREAIAFYAAHGLRSGAIWAATETTWVLLAMGEWDECVRVCDQVTATDRALGAGHMRLWAQAAKANVLLARGRVAEAAALRDEFLPPARQIGDSQIRIRVLSTAAMVEVAEGRPAEATAALARLPAEDIAPLWLGYFYPAPVRALVAAGEIGAARAWMAVGRAAQPRAQHGEVACLAILAEAEGRLEEAAVLHGDAAARWDAFHTPYEQGLSLLGQGRCLVGLGRPADAAPVLRQAGQIFTALEAASDLDEAEALLSRAG